MLGRYNPIPLSTFDHINAQKIRKAAVTTHGSHGSSGLDANEWRRILTHFGQQSGKYQRHKQKSWKRWTEILNPDLLEPYNACRLIPSDKNPGVRPIGIDKVIRRITCRTITK